MKKLVLIATALLASCVLAAQKPSTSPTFEVATIKPVESTPKSARYIVMQGPHRFVEKDYTLKLLIAAAYNLNPKAVSGGPSWIETDHYDILALTLGKRSPRTISRWSCCALFWPIGSSSPSTMSPKFSPSTHSKSSRAVRS